MTRTLCRSLLCSLLLLLAGCGTTQLTDSWQEPGFHRKDMDNVLVVGVTGNKTNRILFERGFGGALADRGIKAIASCDVIGTSMPTREAVLDYVHRSNVTHVIAVHYGGKEVTLERVPESVRTYYTGPYTPYYGSYWDRYGTTQTFTRESYIDSRSNVVLTTSVFDAKTEKLVWVGRSKSFEVDAISHASGELAGKIVRNID